MNDAEFDALRAKIDQLVDWWAGSLGLKWWKITSIFSREPLGHSAEGYKAGARCDAQWEYLLADITFAMPDLLGLTDEDLERVVVHELQHIFLNEMRHARGEDGSAHEERVATMLTYAFLWLRDAAVKQGKDTKEQADG